ncbi:peptidoglycan-binding protein [Leptolyngbya sp. FACHB-261]|uniref:peptidoglycan-binding domain-containing protein n=1 Tax=Leptolyngbya sp. FACHB-261 TaxID=2692806 RepID=UPI001681DEE7|nr:peptidoglycan-binding protein [Leptolyngbya sp. FACHB-261]MBD2099729.1 peptidoglycan-binding protein [Leptolyngbya sp. FACHB-261]
MNTEPGANSRIDRILPTPELHPWASGPAVIELQELLRAHGFGIKADGDFGGITEAAVKAYQRQQGLRPDAVIGPKTWAALRTTVQPGTRVLREGYSGVDVRELQGLLQICGHPVSRNSLFDSETKQAVLAFQRRHQLKDDAVVGPITWTVLRGGPPLPQPPKQTGWYVNPRKWW